MATTLYRFRDLKERRIVNSWPQLKRLQAEQNFPRGRMLSPNTRAWTDAEIENWIASRPQENATPLRGIAKLKRAGKRETTE